jgi:hypothetical protein
MIEQAVLEPAAAAENGDQAAGDGEEECDGRPRSPSSDEWSTFVCDQSMLGYHNRGAPG